MKQIIDSNLTNLDGQYPVGDYIHQWQTIAKEYARIIQKNNIQNKPVILFCTGSSGAIIASLVSIEINVLSIQHIKKDGEQSHHNVDEYSLRSCEYNVIVDDFIVTGTSIERILSKSDSKFDLCVVWRSDPEVSFQRLKLLVKGLYTNET